MKQRLDLFLVNKYKTYTRSKISSMIEQKKVTVNQQVIDRAGFLVNEKDDVCINFSDNYVSRGSYKLKKALEHYKIDLNNKVCLDIGCSTGGFSQVMLEYNAKKVYAIDVGTDQFDSKLANDSRIKLFENQHFLKVNSEFFVDKIDFIACDVSFISCIKIITHVNSIFNYPWTMICLIKPQFELNKQLLSKTKGLIVNNKHHQQAITNVVSAIKNLDLKCEPIIESPIQGAKKGNKEFLILIRK